MIDGAKSAGLVFNRGGASIAAEWGAANVHPGDRTDVFRVFGTGNPDASDDKGVEGVDVSQTLHLKLDVKKDGSLTYTFGNKGGTVRTIETAIKDWKGGYIGLLTFDSTARFSNISFEDRTVETSDEPLKDITVTESYKTDLSGLKSAENGTWEVKEEGLYSNALGKGDCFLYSDTQGSNFVYSTDVTFKQNTGAAALTFRSKNMTGTKDGYVVNLDAGSKMCKFWRWKDGVADQLINEKEVPVSENNAYTLKVVAIDSWISYYVNDMLVASTADYYLAFTDGVGGQDTCRTDGYFGLLNWNGEMVFQNTTVKAIDDTFTPLLSDIAITSEGTVEDKTQFVPTEPTTIQYVKQDAETVNVAVTKKNNDAEVTVTDAAGTIYENGANIPVDTGANCLNITSRMTAEDGTAASVTYRVNVHRRQADEIYYNELYRDQYHYSVKDGWANDPNGIVYFKGKYHLFYQFYDDIKWGPMHWAHAVSTDMIHWEEKPVALYPDVNGMMYSGCIVTDTENTSGFFNNIEGGGLVALITANGNGQRIKLAYSTDEGDTWTKVDKIAADWSNDPLGSKDFRDPKVFRWENKWFMVVAGGPLRIYSSDNLRDWVCESACADLYTECPDLYPVMTEDNTVKWVLSRGGRYYKIGDFTNTSGKWRFVADEGYNASNSNEDSGIMNFGKDSYAAMTYYVQDFGTAENPAIPEIVEVNWMNTWDNYCNLVAEKSGEKFNGTFNLSLKLGLTKENGKYFLTQTPIEAYKDLRVEQNKIEFANEEVGENNTLLNGFKGSSYEIVSKFTPAAGTKKVGFKVRTGGEEATAVVYDLETETLSIDRSKSGIMISDRFAEVDSQKVTKNADGTIDLHIYVDRASVEVFTKGYTAAGANQIFPSVTSDGASVLVEGDAARADITIYPMQSIWNRAEVKVPVSIETSSQAESKMNVADSLELSAYLLPIEVEQNIAWSITEGNDIVSIEENENSAKITALKKGTARFVRLLK